MSTGHGFFLKVASTYRVEEPSSKSLARPRRYRSINASVYALMISWARRGSSEPAAIREEKSGRRKR